MNRWHPLPRQLYELVENDVGTLLFETSRQGASPLSRIFTRPLCVIEARTAAELDAMFLQIEDAIQQDHFAAGFFTYECGQCFEPAATRHADRGSGDLLAWMAIYDQCYCFDHLAGAFAGEAPRNPSDEQHRGAPPPVLSFGLDQDEYAARIARIHEWIRSGDVYQLNFTFPLAAKITESPAQLYARLQAVQPVEYGAFLHCLPGRYILSISPELFFRVEQDGDTRRITAQPMKGTAHRGRTTAEDRRIADWLTNDRKNRAENVMIVDLIRNDLGRICNFGTVQVDKLFKVERFPTLCQMTSMISGDLRPGVRHQDIFHALFPCGSVTGAPKIRAMQLLAQIEGQPRGVYTGAIGFLSRKQTVFNVAIRTLMLEDHQVTMGIGSGIVIDSDPEAEFRECKLKAEFLTRTSDPFSLLETMLWDRGFPLLNLHLDRLADSADYFGFACDRTQVEAALHERSASFADHRPYRVRLTLDTNGTIDIESEPIDQQNPNAIAQIRIAGERTDPDDPFLFHKTTRRAPYNRAFASASAAGFADVLFFNTRDQLTEGAISNIVIEKSGRFYTPPIECGLLPGVYRRHLLETRSDLEEHILTLPDLLSADAIYICNAVRGLRKVLLSLT